MTREELAAEREASKKRQEARLVQREVQQRPPLSFGQVDLGWVTNRTRRKDLDYLPALEFDQP